MAGGKQDNAYDNPAVGWIMIGIVLIVIGILVWYAYRVQLSDAIRWIRYAEMRIAAPFLPDDYMIKHKGKEGRFFSNLEQVPQYKAKDIRYEHLALFSSMAMQPLKMLFVSLLGAGAAWCLFLGPTTQYRRRLGIQELIEVQAKNFPYIQPFIRFNPAKEPPRPPGAPVPVELPLFSEALSPEEWIAFNNIPVPDGKVDGEAAADCFAQQLGARWRGVNALAPHKQILLAGFCLKASRKRNEADELIGELATCWDYEEGLLLKRRKKILERAQEILRNKDLGGKTLTVCNQHAFETTALLRGLAFAREQGGVLASAQFVWLRGYDRALWYPLNNLGRQAYHMEAMGALCHYKAERLTRRPIPVPKVENAVKTISDYMASSRARPIPPLDYSKSKKRGVKKAA